MPLIGSLPASLCVYCGSRPGNNPRFAAAAQSLGAVLAAHGVRLVYGGGSVGLMGILARSVLEHGGEVTGVIPAHLDSTEITQCGLTELQVVTGMHERKRMMFDLSDAFLALPGSIGTLDETIEVITWRQLRLHDKPVLFLDLDGYWQPFLDMIGHMIGQGFTNSETPGLFGMVSRVEDILPALAQARPPRLPDRQELL